MTFRREDANMLEWLRRLQARVERLDRGNTGVRQNDLRLGDSLFGNDNDNMPNVTNLRSGKSRPVFGVQETVFSYPGAISGGEQISGSWTAPEQIRLVNVTATMRVGAAVAFTVNTSASGAVLNTSFDTTKTVNTFTLDTAMDTGHNLFVSVTGGTLGGYDLVITVRYRPIF